jgi:hypothetical protein
MHYGCKVAQYFSAVAVMRINVKVRNVRICYWVGAIADAITIIPMLIPQIGGWMFDITDFDPGVEYNFAMAMGASLMLGWTFLLVWADRKPVERSGILLLTIFPVLVGLMSAGIYAVAVDVVDIKNMIPMWIFQIGLAILFLFGYMNAREIKNICK